MKINPLKGSVGIRVPFKRLVRVSRIPSGHFADIKGRREVGEDRIAERNGSDIFDSRTAEYWYDLVVKRAGFNSVFHFLGCEFDPAQEFFNQGVIRFSDGVEELFPVLFNPF